MRKARAVDAAAGRSVRFAAALIVAGGLWPPTARAGAASYASIQPTAADRTIVLTGHDLTIEQLVEIARLGARVALSPQAQQHAADAYGLLLEGAAEGVPIYGFNRGSGAQREIKMFQGDPFAPANRGRQQQRQLTRFEEESASDGYGPEVADEAMVRATMAVRLNTMAYEAASPEVTQLLQAFLNDRITPVVQSHGGIGEGDLEQMHNIAGAMVGVGEVYLKGVRMPARQALAQVGLQPYTPIANDDFRSLTSTDAYAIGLTALLVADGRRALDWADLIYAMDLDGMNSSVTPLSAPVQDARPIKWLRWDADRVLGMIRGGYLFDADPTRIIQDPESLRASSIRQGSAWAAWADLRDVVRTQMNSSDHNPTVRVGVAPTDSWELATPQFMKFYVRGGRYSSGEHGYILSNANWDPYPLANEIEAFNNAMANMDVAISLRIQRFTNPFFTVVKPSDVLSSVGAGARADREYAPQANEKVAVDLWQTINSLQAPIVPEGQSIESTAEDLQAQTGLKLQRARETVSYSIDLLGQDLLTASFWMDVRHLQDARREFGQAPTAVWRAFRQIIPFHRDQPKPFGAPPGATATAFLRANAAEAFLSNAQRTASPLGEH